jgi:hypothetical protein
MTELINAMSRAQDPWCIVAGAATALHTGDWADVHDIDVVVSLPDAHRLIALSEFIDRTDGGNDVYRSKVYATLLGPVEIDIFAEFEICAAGAWTRINPLPIPVVTPAGRVYVPELREQIAITRMLGRAKDGPRIVKLEKLLQG